MMKTIPIVRCFFLSIFLSHYIHFFGVYGRSAAYPRSRTRRISNWQRSREKEDLYFRERDFSSQQQQEIERIPKEYPPLNDNFSIKIGRKKDNGSISLLQELLNIFIVAPIQEIQLLFSSIHRSLYGLLIGRGFFSFAKQVMSKAFWIGVSLLFISFIYSPVVVLSKISYIFATYSPSNWENVGLSSLKKVMHDPSIKIKDIGEASKELIMLFFSFVHTLLTNHVSRKCLKVSLYMAIIGILVGVLSQALERSILGENKGKKTFIEHAGTTIGKVLLLSIVLRGKTIFNISNREAFLLSYFVFCAIFLLSRLPRFYTQKGVQQSLPRRISRAFFGAFLTLYILIKARKKLIGLYGQGILEQENLITGQVHALNEESIEGKRTHFNKKNEFIEKIILSKMQENTNNTPKIEIKSGKNHHIRAEESVNKLLLNPSSYLSQWRKMYDLFTEEINISESTLREIRTNTNQKSLLIDLLEQINAIKKLVKQKSDALFSALILPLEKKIFTPASHFSIRVGHSIKNFEFVKESSKIGQTLAWLGIEESKKDEEGSIEKSKNAIKSTFFDFLSILLIGLNPYI